MTAPVLETQARQLARQYLTLKAHVIAAIRGGVDARALVGRTVEIVNATEGRGRPGFFVRQVMDKAADALDREARSGR